MRPEQELDLLRAFEPIVRFTRGELFLPTSVADYVARSALFRQLDPGAEQLAAEGTLDLDRLAALGDRHTGEPLYLRFVANPLRRRQYRHWRRRPDRDRFRPASRFAAVGLASRLLDSVLRLTLTLRGKVPARFAAAAERSYRTLAAYRQPCYYGHVTRDAGYVALQYWYFYPMNDWRSTFGGINDHEADWEQVTLFLVPDRDGEPIAGPAGAPTIADRAGDGHGLRPAWVAFSSHDEVGDDLRRRWDDPDLERVGNHPVVYAGAGSHSGGYLPGDYVITAELPAPAAMKRAWASIRRVLPGSRSGPGGFGIPYIDYRRGDGARVGPGEDLPWTAIRIDDDTPWVRDYRGLWGLDTRDPLGGERAPAGPRYERDRSVRSCWTQPVAWAGLDKEPPTEAQAHEHLAVRHREARAELASVDRRLDDLRGQLRGARVAARAASRAPTDTGDEVAALSRQVESLRHRQAELRDESELAEHGLGATLPVDGVHAHLHRRALPIEPGSRRSGRLIRVWSAASASILLAAFGYILLNGRRGIFTPFISLVAVMIMIEAALRRRLLVLLLVLAALLLFTTVAWAVIATIFGNFEQGVGVLLILAALYMAWQTLREGLRIR